MAAPSPQSHDPVFLVFGFELGDSGFCKHVLLFVVAVLEHNMRDPWTLLCCRLQSSHCSEPLLHCFVTFCSFVCGHLVSFQIVPLKNKADENNLRYAF